MRRDKCHDAMLERTRRQKHEVSDSAAAPVALASIRWLTERISPSFPMSVLETTDPDSCRGDFSIEDKHILLDYKFIELEPTRLMVNERSCQPTLG